MLHLEPEQQPTPDVTERSAPAKNTPVGDLVEEELLVEEISIDGMCGVY